MKKEIKINLFTKVLLKLWPRTGMRLLAKKLGIKKPIFNEAHKLFSQVSRIDFLPLESGYRGFMLVLNRKTAVYFYQESDYFIYDGYEMGDYEKGDITIFDSLKRTDKDRRGGGE